MARVQKHVEPDCRQGREVALEGDCVASPYVGQVVPRLPPYRAQLPSNAVRTQL